MLFVSGERIERIPKAFAAGADLVCIDLEDAVHPDLKQQAREQVIAWLKENHRPGAGGCGVALRINGTRTAEGLRDAALLLDSGVKLDWLLLPKVESAGDVACVRAWFGDRCGALAALIESPQGIEDAFAIARSLAPADALMLGGADLSAELDAQFGWDGLLSARGRLVNAAKAAGVQAWDVPNVDLSDDGALETETRRIRQLGFDCKTAIHPKQISTIHAAFEPSAEEREWAQVLLQAVPAGHDSGAFLFKGRMVDAPLLRKARRIHELVSRS